MCGCSLLEMLLESLMWTTVWSYLLIQTQVPRALPRSQELVWAWRHDVPLDSAGCSLRGSQQPVLKSNEGKMRMEEDFFHTFENFKVVPNLVLMIHVSVQSAHKGLKSARWSEIVFRKSDLIPWAKWSLPTAIRENQSPQQTLIWQMHKRFKRAEVSFTFLALIWDFLLY